MAEESPRPGSEEDSEEEAEEGDGEEAAQAPARVAVPAPVRRVDKEEEPEDEEDVALPEDPPPGEEEEASPPPPADHPAPSQATPRSPISLHKVPRPSLLGAAPAFPAYPPVPPLYYSPPVVLPMYSPQPAAASTSGVNLFANDGSFMELFKKKMESGGKEESKAEEEEDKKPEPEKRKPVSFVGKRRGGAKLALKTGMVAKKPKSEDEELLSRKGGAWAQYMAEVKKYKAHQCSDDDKTRPLVK